MCRRGGLLPKMRSASRVQNSYVKGCVGNIIVVKMRVETRFKGMVEEC